MGSVRHLEFTLCTLVLAKQDDGLVGQIDRCTPPRFGGAKITTDGLTWYEEAVERAFGGDVDYAIVSKRYGQEYGGTTRYSPAKLKSAIKEVIRGNPDPRHISTSYIERQNLTMRMSMRRFTRLTNAFSKKAQNHAHAVALHFMYYNFGRIHQTLRVTPAMQAEMAEHVWTVEENRTSFRSPCYTGGVRRT